jgi:hypothetical protein
VQPRDESVVVPFLEDGLLEHQGLGLQEAIETAAEAVPVHVEEEPVRVGGVDRVFDLGLANAQGSLLRVAGIGLALGRHAHYSGGEEGGHLGHISCVRHPIARCGLFEQSNWLCRRAFRHQSEPLPLHMVPVRFGCVASSHGTHQV